MSILGLDIGGANIKGADEAGRAVSRSFAMWKHPERLADELASILHSFPQTERVAVTMTAELADCFETKSEGVRFILDAVVASTGARPIEVWTTASRFVAESEAALRPREVAAANWHALATWCGSLVPAGASLLIDIGTTTTDIIPLVEKRPVARGLTDVGRLQTGELSYSGVKRTKTIFS